MIVLYIVPVCVSGYLYLMIIQTLRSQPKHAERNRNLSICFFASWCFWAICWAPKFVISIMQLPSQPLELNLGKGGNTFLVYLFISLPSIQVLYSQLNPFLYLILFKSFQQRILTLLKLVLCIKVPRVSLITRQNERETVSKRLTKDYIASFISFIISMGLISLLFTCVTRVYMDNRAIADGFSQVRGSRIEAINC